MKANEIQGSDEWLAQRAGNFTASRSPKLMARTKTGWGASRGELLSLLAVERLTGQCVPTYTNAAMQRGVDLEAEARDAYAFATLSVVEECGFIASDDLPNCGASPDGLVGDDGLLEVKCPANMEKHLEALRSGAHAIEYRWQLQHQLMVTGRQWVDAVSYDPRYPEELQLAITRVPRDEKAIAELRAAVVQADAEVEATVTELRGMKLAA